MIRLLASLLLLTGLSVSATQPCVGEEVPVHAQSVSDIPEHSSGEPSPVSASVAPPVVEDVPPGFFSWKEITTGTALLLSPAALGFVPVDWASVAELIGQWL